MLAIITTHPIQYQVPLWQALAKDGRVPFEVWYLTFHGVATSPDQEFSKSFAWDLDMLAGYPHRLLNLADHPSPAYFWRCRLRERLRNRLGETGARALWIQGWQVAAYWQAVWEAKAAGIEVWLRGESNDLAPIPYWKVPIKGLVLTQLFKRVDRFLYIGSANRRLYEKFGTSPKQLYPAPYAVDNKRFARQAEAIRGQRSEIRSQWRISEDAFVVLFCGKFIPKKRPLDLIKAAQILRKEHPQLNMHLLFVGSGKLGAEMRGACSVVFDAEDTNSGASSVSSGKPRASFAGFLNQTQISKAYITADVLVLPSDHGETWGLVVNEAMASGLSCIVSDQCGCAEDLVSNESGRCFPCGDITSLAKALQTFHGLRPTAGSARAAVERFSIAATVETIASLSQLIQL